MRDVNCDPPPQHLSKSDIRLDDGAQWVPSMEVVLTKVV